MENNAFDSNELNEIKAEAAEEKHHQSDDSNNLFETLPFLFYEQLNEIMGNRK